MSRLKHLLCRHGWYYLRLRVPKDLAALVGRREICLSLKTRCPKSAQDLLVIKTAEFTKIFTLGRSRLLSREHMQALLRQSAVNQLTFSERQRDRGNRTFAGHELEAGIDFNLSAIEQSLSRLNYILYLPYLRWLAKEHGVTAAEDSEEFGRFCREALKSLRDVMKIEKQRCQGDYDNDYDKALRLPLTPPAAITPTPDAAAPQPAPGKVPVGKRLSDAITTMLQERGHHLGDKTKREYESYRDFVLDLVGDKDLSEYTRESMLAAREALKMFPKRARHEPELKQLSVKQIMSMTIDGPKLMERTYQKYLSFLTTVFNYCVDDLKALPYNPCPEWKKSRDLRANEGWAPFDAADLEKFFTSSYFIKPAVRIRNPENFWIPLIARYTGMRVDEICQLYVNDIRKVDGIWCFDINEKDDKKLKNLPSKRVIPVPPQLIELGFLEYVRSVKHKRLWPNLKRGQNGYSHNYDKAIGKHIRRHVTQDREKVFHSFRDTFAAEMQASGVSDTIYGAILGHTPAQAVTAKYAGKVPVALMLEAMQTVKHRLDVTALLRQGKPAAKQPAKVVALRQNKLLTGSSTRGKSQPRTKITRKVAKLARTNG